MNYDPIESPHASHPPTHVDATGRPELADKSEFKALGVLDIVESFTALRHELKLQVRDGRQLQQTLGASLQRMEERMVSLSASGDRSPTNETARDMALALAEIEESLRRAVETLSQQVMAEAPSRTLLEQFEQLVQQSSWATRRFASKLIQESRSAIVASQSASHKPDEILTLSLRGLELLLDRVQRLMQQCSLVRLDVQFQAFNAETMHAVDVVESDSVPSSHVAEQLRPGYFWKNQLLRCADVRLAK